MEVKFGLPRCVINRCADADMFACANTGHTLITASHDLRANAASLTTAPVPSSECEARVIEFHVAALLNL